MEHSLDYKNPPNYSSYRKRSNERFSNDEVFITEEEFKTLSEQECYYCGKEGPNGIDRVDNTRGYKKDNCVPCCKHCNYVKGDLSKSDFNIWKNRFVKKQSTQKWI